MLTSIVFMILFYYKSLQEGKAQIFLNVILKHYVKGPLRMLRPGGKFWEKNAFTFRFNVFIENVI